MDERGRALDNVFCERLWRRFKYENIYLNQYDMVRQLHTELSAYFDFYNHERPHQSPDYRTPAERALRALFRAGRIRPSAPFLSYFVVQRLGPTIFIKCQRDLVPALCPPSPNVLTAAVGLFDSQEIPMDIRSILQTWLNALTKPGEAFFAAEREKSSAALSNALLWVFAASVISALLGVLQSSILSSAMGVFDQVMELLPSELQDEITTSEENGSAVGPTFSLSYIVFGPVLFLIGTGIYHVLASLLGGRGGQYGRYTYLYSTFSAPLMILTSILGFIPVIGGIIGFVLGVYQMVLAYFATKVEYSLTKGRAIIVVVASVLFGMLLAACLNVVALVAILFILGDFA